jgi:hypothetical protein
MKEIWSMKKILISVTARQDLVFRKLAEELGIPLVEVIRRALDAYIEDSAKKGSLKKHKRKAPNKEDSYGDEL